MSPVLAETIDRFVIDRARPAKSSRPPRAAVSGDVAAFLSRPNFSRGHSSSSAELVFDGARDFRFVSEVRTPWEENNTVYGMFFRAGEDWRRSPTVLLAHGWNGEAGYRFQFPWLAGRLARQGCNAAMIELPYHGRRRPRRLDAIRDFISDDLAGMAEAVKQAISDFGTVLRWARREGSAPTGIWGFSLGGWLGGLAASHDALVQAAVLTTPVVRLGQVITDLPFCGPIRRALDSSAVSLEGLDLANQPIPGCSSNLLLVESIYDQFVRPESVEEVWRAWGRPEIWRAPHGHISVLLSLPLMARAARWISERLRGGA